MKTIRGKTAVVTGAASGIGRAIATSLAGEGASLVLIDIDADGLQCAATDLRRTAFDDVRTLVCDLGSSAAIDAAAEKIATVTQGLDILVNNAGIAYYGQAERMTDEQFQRVLDVNLWAPIRLTRKLLPLLMKREESHIVNVGSLAGLVARGKLMAYQVSKFGLQGFSESLIAEYGRFGLGVTSVCPGYVRTSLFENGHNARGRRGFRPPPDIITTTAPVVARKTVRAIYRNRPLVTITPVAHVLWFLKRLAPTAFLSFAGRRRHGGRRPFTPKPGKPQGESERRAA